MARTNRETVTHWEEMSLAEAFQESITADWDPADCEYKGELPAWVFSPVASMVFDDFVLLAESIPGQPPRFWIGRWEFSTASNRAQVS